MGLALDPWLRLAADRAAEGSSEESAVLGALEDQRELGPEDVIGPIERPPVSIRAPELRLEDARQIHQPHVARDHGLRQRIEVVLLALFEGEELRRLSVLRDVPRDL
ncbi:MAG: hypothetical protein R3A52_28000 [Polyangiales bacterium]